MLKARLSLGYNIAHYITLFGKRNRAGRLFVAIDIKSYLLYYLGLPRLSRPKLEPLFTFNTFTDSKQTLYWFTLLSIVHIMILKSPWRKQSC